MAPTTIKRIRAALERALWDADAKAQHVRPWHVDFDACRREQAGAAAALADFIAEYGRDPETAGTRAFAAAVDIVTGCGR